METSASFEARSAPSLDPTASLGQRGPAHDGNSEILDADCLVTERVARHSRLPFEVSHRAASFEEVRYALRHLEELTRAHDFAGVYARHIRPWFFELDGRAAGRVAEFIIERARTSGSRVPQIWLRRSLRGSRDRSTGLQVVQAVVANLVGSRAASGRLAGPTAEAGHQRARPGRAAPIEPDR